MELNLDAGGGKGAQLPFIDDLEQLLFFDFVKRHVEGLGQFLQKDEPLTRG